MLFCFILKALTYILNCAGGSNVVGGLPLEGNRLGYFLPTKRNVLVLFKSYQVVLFTAQPSSLAKTFSLINYCQAILP